MVGLVDVNVLVALFVPGHEHHALATSWFSADAPEGWATCAVTELGVIRVCAQLLGKHSIPTTAYDLLMLRASVSSHSWWPDAVSPAVLPEVQRAPTGKQVTDHYLLGLARRKGGRVVTLDRELARAGGRDVLCLLPPKEHVRTSNLPA